jgi:protein involved in polysaccharide export with SLBB domain
LKFKLRAGDLVMIPESRLQISVSGAVLKPGPYDMQDGRTLRVSEAIALAGGLGPKAALTKALVRHADETETPVDLYKVTILGSQEDNRVLVDGDAIVVPESRGVTVLGAVQKPGNYYIEEGREPRVADVLGQAGGLSIKPELARITIARSASAATAATSPATTIDAKGTAAGMATTPSATATVNSIAAVDLLELSDPNQNERVRDGDIITVSTIKLQTVFISGEVVKPGSYDIQEGEKCAATYCASRRSHTFSRPASGKRHAASRRRYIKG